MTKEYMYYGNKEMKGNCIEQAAETIQQVCWGYEKKMHAIEGKKRENEEENYSTQNNFVHKTSSYTAVGHFFHSWFPSDATKKCNFLMNEKRELNTQKKNVSGFFFSFAFVSHSFLYSYIMHFSISNPFYVSYVLRNI